MCGRYVLANNLSQISMRFDATVSADIQWPGTYNASPGQQLPVLITQNGKLTIALMKWGLFPGWATQQAGITPSINARCETLLEKPFFRSAFRSRRCLIPANGFYEWTTVDQKKQPHYIFPEEPLVAIAGLWEPPAPHSQFPTFAIVTQAANNFMKQLHERMPVILTRQEEQNWMKQISIERSWFESTASKQNNLKMTEHKVSPQMNNAKNNAPTCIMPVLSLQRLL